MQSQRENVSLTTEGRGGFPPGLWEAYGIPQSCSAERWEAEASINRLSSPLVEGCLWSMNSLTARFWNLAALGAWQPGASQHFPTQLWLNSEVGCTTGPEVCCLTHFSPLDCKFLVSGDCPFCSLLHPKSPAQGQTESRY